MQSRFKPLFLISIPLFVLHGLEEILSGFYNIDSHVRFVFGWLEPAISLQVSFIALQLVFWAVLILAYLFLTRTRWSSWLAIFLGLLFVYELHHAYKALVTGAYYPGLLTAFLLYVLSFFYWKELAGILLKSTLQTDNENNS